MKSNEKMGGGGGEIREGKAIISKVNIEKAVLMDEKRRLRK